MDWTIESYFTNREEWGNHKCKLGLLWVTYEGKKNL